MARKAVQKRVKVVKVRATSRKSSATMFAEEGYVGRETTDWSVVSPSDFKNKFRETLRHYNYFYENKDHYQWALAWAKSNKQYLDKIKNAPEYEISPTIGGICRMLTNGCVLNTHTTEWFYDKLDNLSTKVVEAKVTDTGISRRSPADIVREKTSDTIAFIESKFDEQDYAFDVYEYLRKENAAGVTAKRIITFYEPLQQEIEQLLIGKDKDLVEGYRHFSIKQKRDLKQFLDNLISDCQKFLGIKKVARKPRVKKVKSAEAKLVKFSYLKESNEYKVGSVNPINIIGASELLMFNTKLKQLTYLKTNSTKGFDIKGSTILNIDEENSFKKMVSKPDIINQAMSKTKAGLAKYMETIKTTRNTASGRSGSDTVILKVYK